MVQTQLSLPDKLDQLVVSIALNQGRKKEDVIIEAVKAFVHDAESSADQIERRGEAFGMWKHRDDLPDFEHLRRSMDRQ